jgi:formylglycine-generating enzyme required for sulfatase activity
MINISDATRLISYLLTGAELEPKEEDENEVETESITVNGVSFDMVKVEGGTFMMGSTTKQGEEALARKNPFFK